jgi:mycothiol synthase
VLWEFDGRVCAFMVVEVEDDGVSFDLYVAPVFAGDRVHQSIFAAAVAIVTERARAAGVQKIWLVWVLESDAYTRALAATHGLTVAEPGYLHFRRALTDPLPAVSLPPGFAFTDGGTEAGRLARAQATHGAFGLSRPWDAYWVKCQAFFGSPRFVGAHTIAIVAPDGQGAAGCTIWLDAVSAIGLFEPVGTHVNFQGRGLGKALLAEGMRRMCAGGMTAAIVSTNHDNIAASALYRAAGFADAGRFVNLSRALQA